MGEESRWGKVTWLHFKLLHQWNIREPQQRVRESMKRCAWGFFFVVVVVFLVIIRVRRPDVDWWGEKDEKKVVAFIGLIDWLLRLLFWFFSLGAMTKSLLMLIVVGKEMKVERESMVILGRRRNLHCNILRNYRSFTSTNRSICTGHYVHSLQVFLFFFCVYVNHQHMFTTCYFLGRASTHSIA